MPLVKREAGIKETMVIKEKYAELEKVQELSHDLNNILTIILFNTEFILATEPEGTDIHKRMVKIEDDCRKAAAMIIVITQLEESDDVEQALRLYRMKREGMDMDKTLKKQHTSILARQRLLMDTLGRIVDQNTKVMDKMAEDLLKARADLSACKGILDELCKDNGEKDLSV